MGAELIGGKVAEAGLGGRWVELIRDAGTPIPPFVPLPAPPPISITPSNGVQALIQLLPPGRLWSLEAGSWLYQVLLALWDEPSRIEGRGNDLVNEADPRTADELLPEWESALGLPDDVITEIPATTALREIAITQKIQRQGGQNASFFIQLALVCGYAITIENDFGALVLRAGFLCGSRCYGEDWAYLWQVNVSPPAGTALTHTQLEAVFNRAKPAHTIVSFNYL